MPESERRSAVNHRSLMSRVPANYYRNAQIMTSMGMSHFRASDMLCVTTIFTDRGRFTECERKSLR